MTLPRMSLALLFLLCSLGMAAETKAQAVTGYTTIDYYADTDTLDAYSETDLDEDLIGEYDAYVSLTIWDGSFSVVASGSEEDQWNGVASVELFYSGTTPDTTYTAKGFHKPIADLWDYDYAWPYYIYYYDDYNFTSFEGQGISAPWYYYFLSPGFQQTHRRTAPINVGSTYDSDSVSTPAGSPDHLQIVSDETRTLSCDILERNVTYRIVDVNNHSTGRQSVREPDNAVVDSCTNQGVGYTDSCTLPQNPFTDTLRAGCPSFGDYDCGYDDPNEQWLWCTAGLPPLATLDYNVRHNRIVISGYTGPLPKKWYVRADRSISPR